MGFGVSQNVEAHALRNGVGKDNTLDLVVFLLDGHRHALALSTVERVVHAVAVTPLPKAPQIVLGAIDFAGRVIPVINLRQRLCLPERPIGPADQFVIVRAAQRTVALVVDAVEGVVATSARALVKTGDIAPGLEYLRGVVQLEDGLVLIQDLEQFLSLDETRALDAALKSDPA